MIMKVIVLLSRWASPCLCLLLPFKSVGAPFSQAGEVDPDILQLLSVFVPGGWVPSGSQPFDHTTALWRGHHWALLETEKLRHPEMKAVWSSKGSASAQGCPRDGCPHSGWLWRVPPALRVLAKVSRGPLHPGKEHEQGPVCSGHSQAWISHSVY